MTEREIKLQIKNAKAIVANWPEWKQNILAYSASASRQTPRTPVVKVNAGKATTNRTVE